MIRLDSDYAHAYYNRGLSYRNLRDYGQTIKDFQQAVNLYQRLAIKDFQQAADLYQQQENTEWYQEVLDRISELEQ